MAPPSRGHRSGGSQSARKPSYHNDCICYLGVSATAPPDGASAVYYHPISINQVAWTYAASSRMLFEAGALSSYDPFPTVPPEGSKDKPKTASLFKDMSVETVSVCRAPRLSPNEIVPLVASVPLSSVKRETSPDPPPVNPPEGGL